jgi:hypothetical protein
MKNSKKKAHLNDGQDKKIDSEQELHGLNRTTT